jgi:hypothetical protein
MKKLNSQGSSKMNKTNSSETVQCDSREISDFRDEDECSRKIVDIRKKKKSGRGFAADGDGNLSNINFCDGDDIAGKSVMTTRSKGSATVAVDMNHSKDRHNTTHANSKDGFNCPNDNANRKSGFASLEDGEALELYQLYVCPYCKTTHEGRKVAGQGGKSAHLSHMMTHQDLFTEKQNSGQYKCKYCERSFKDFHGVYNHVKMVSGENLCSVCKEEIQASCEILKHKRVHRRYCKWCDISLPDLIARDFVRHLRKHKRQEFNEGKRGEENAVCMICGNVYPDKESLYSHMFTHSKNSVACAYPGCHKQFKNRMNLSRHELIHGKKNQICETCGQRFLTRDSLRNHMQSHGGKTHQCSQCQKAFTKLSSLKEHVDVVHGGPTLQKKFPCSVCQKMFARQKDARRHAKYTHSNIRPFQCTKCGAAFKEARALRQHMQTHSNTKPYK